QRSPKAHPQSKGSAAKNRLLRPRFCFAHDSAHQKLTRNPRAPQPKTGCYALAFASRTTALTKSSPAIQGLRSQKQAATPSLLLRARQRSPKAHPQSKGSAAKNRLLRPRFCFAHDSAHQKLTPSTRKLQRPQGEFLCLQPTLISF